MAYLIDVTCAGTDTDGHKPVEIARFMCGGAPPQPSSFEPWLVSAGKRAPFTSGWRIIGENLDRLELSCTRCAHRSSVVRVRWDTLTTVLDRIAATSTEEAYVPCSLSVFAATVATLPGSRQG